jgi:hypothetical protein
MRELISEFLRLLELRMLELEDTDARLSTEEEMLLGSDDLLVAVFRTSSSGTDTIEPRLLSVATMSVEDFFMP